FGGVFLAENRIENRLFGQARRKRTHARSADQSEFSGANRPPKRNAILGHSVLPAGLARWPGGRSIVALRGGRRRPPQDERRRGKMGDVARRFRRRLAPRAS